MKKQKELNSKCNCGCHSSESSDVGMKKNGCDYCQKLYHFKPEPIFENWEIELADYGALHNENCCVNFPEDSRACDVGMGDTDCCENMQSIARFVLRQKQKSYEEGYKDGQSDCEETHIENCGEFH